MNSVQKRLVPVLCGAASLLFLFVAAKPAIDDRPVNLTFVVFAAAFFVFAIVFWLRLGSGTAAPRS